MSDTQRATRSGEALGRARNIRAADRDCGDTNEYDDNIGLRIALTVDALTSCTSVQIIRGDIWPFAAYSMHAAFRFHKKPNRADNSLGFRLARTNNV